MFTKHREDNNNNNDNNNNYDNNNDNTIHTHTKHATSPAVPKIVSYNDNKMGDRKVLPV